MVEDSLWSPSPGNSNGSDSWRKPAPLQVTPQEYHSLSSSTASCSTSPSIYMTPQLIPAWSSLHPASPDDFILRNSRMKTKNQLDNFLNPQSDLFKPDGLHVFGSWSLWTTTLTSVQCLSCVVGCFSLLVSHTCVWSVCGDCDVTVIDNFTLLWEHRGL